MYMCCGSCGVEGKPCGATYRMSSMKAALQRAMQCGLLRSSHGKQACLHCLQSWLQRQIVARQAVASLKTYQLSEWWEPSWYATKCVRRRIDARCPAAHLGVALDYVNVSGTANPARFLCWAASLYIASQGILPSGLSLAAL